jgi:hypothetical protein
MYLMREIEKEARPAWEQFLSRAKTSKFLDNEDCDPRLLYGWTEENISIWDVSELDGKPLKTEIEFAICHPKKYEWKKATFLIFNGDAVATSGLRLSASDGGTGEIEIDTSKTHFDIISITGKQLCSLLFHISQKGFVIEEFTKAMYDARKIQIINDSRQYKTIMARTNNEPPSINNIPAGTELPRRISTEIATSNIWTPANSSKIPEQPKEN